MEENTPPSSLVQAVDRAITLLQLVSRGAEPIRIGELAEQAQLNRTTAWRLLATLEHHGLVERDPLTHGYRIGYGAALLAAGTTQHGWLARRARPTLERLADETNETVNLSVPRHYATVAIDQIDPPHSVRLIDYINLPLPLHCTSNGKLLLAYLSPAELDVFLQRPLEARTARTITDPARLRRELEVVRSRGVGITLGELDDGVNGISAPIVDDRGDLLAFVSVSGPDFRLPEDRLLALAPRVLRAAQDIARILGTSR